MNARRLLVCLAALPLAFYAYACSSDSTDTPAEEEYLADGEEIGYTESAIVLERLIGKVVHNFNADKDEKKESGAEDATQ